MYSRFQKAYDNAKNELADTRSDWIKPLILLCDIKLFNKEKKCCSDEYQIISEVLYKLKEINTEKKGYHRFAYFREIVSYIGFLPSEKRYNIDRDVVLFIVSIIKQILNFEYQ